jgi:hypothetical protein
MDRPSRKIGVYRWPHEEFLEQKSSAALRLGKIMQASENFMCVQCTAVVGRIRSCTVVTRLRTAYVSIIYKAKVPAWYSIFESSACATAASITLCCVA